MNESDGWTNVLQTLLSDVAEQCTLLALLPVKTVGTVGTQGDAGCARSPAVQHLGLGHPAFLAILFPRFEDSLVSSGSATDDISAICGTDIPSNRPNETRTAAAIRSPLHF